MGVWVHLCPRNYMDYGNKKSPENSVNFSYTQ